MNTLALVALIVLAAGMVALAVALVVTMRSLMAHSEFLVRSVVAKHSGELSIAERSAKAPTPKATTPTTVTPEDVFARVEAARAATGEPARVPVGLDGT